jgi:hypothetical protein
MPTVRKINPTQDWDNDTGAIQDALDLGDPILLGPGDFYLEGIGSEILHMKYPGSPFVGCGNGRRGGTRLVVRSTVPQTRDVLRISPVEYDRGPLMGNFSIVGETPSARAGRHGIHVDLTEPAGGGTATGWIVNGKFENISIWELYGRSFYLTNPTIVDGFFSNIFDNVWARDGFCFNRLGDSNEIRNCKFWDFIYGGAGIPAAGEPTINGDSGAAVPSMTPGKIGIEVVSMVQQGANVLVVRNCNSTQAGGFIKFNGLRLMVETCNAEVYTDNGATAIVEITGGYAAGFDHNSTLRNCQLYAIGHSGVGTATCSTVKLNNLKYGVIESSHFMNTASGKYCLEIGSGCQNLLVDKNVWLEALYGATPSLNSGTGTVFR